MLGDLIGEFKGKVMGLRVLSEGKVETSEQGSGSILGVEATMLATAISTPMPNGVLMGEGDALVTTADGEVVMIRKIGIGWSTGKGRKASKRGVFFHMTQSQKLARLNKVVGVWEFESEENGDWHVKIWEWK
jgi:hypothetical protein